MSCPPSFTLTHTKEESFEAFMSLNVGDTIHLTRAFPTRGGVGYSTMKVTMNEKMIETGCRSRETFNTIWSAMDFAMDKHIVKCKEKKKSNKKKSKRNRKRRRLN